MIVLVVGMKKQWLVAGGGRLEPAGTISEA